MTRLASAVTIVAICSLLVASPVGAHSLTSRELAGVGFEPHPGTQAPTDLTFKDELGAPVRLADYFGQRPVVLTLNYFT